MMIARRIELWMAAALLAIAIWGGVSFCTNYSSTYRATEERTNAKPF